jgi:hypothetical protein
MGVRLGVWCMFSTMEYRPVGESRSGRVVVPMAAPVEGALPLGRGLATPTVRTERAVCVENQGSVETRLSMDSGKLCSLLTPAPSRRTRGGVGQAYEGAEVTVLW